MGAGPAGVVAGKHALEARFEVTVFEADDDLGGRWNTTSAGSGVWPGMRTNTSRAMTAFSDFPVQVWALTGRELRLHLRTPHPAVPGLGFIGQYATSAPTSRCSSSRLAGS